MASGDGEISSLPASLIAESELDSGTLFSTILASIRDGVIATNAMGNVQFVNPAAETLTGWSMTEAFGAPIEAVYPLSDMNRKPLVDCLLRRALASGDKQDKVRSFLTSRAGLEIAIEDSAAPLFDLSGEMNGAVTIFMEVTNKLRSEQQISEEREQLRQQMEVTTGELGFTRTELRALASRLLTAQEEERRRLARDLHDDACQRVALLEMEAHRLESFPLLEEVRAGLVRMRGQADLLVSNLRDLSHQLHPPELEHLGLAAALRLLAEEYRGHGLDLSFSVRGVINPIASEAATGLYRIAQEALHNILKHARHAPACLDLQQEEGQLSLRITDEGPGFDETKAKARSGLGLISMQERAHLAGGSIQLTTKLGKGTSLLVQVPVA